MPTLEVEQVLSMLPALLRTGTTTFCPTLITNSQESLIRNLRVLEQARKASPHLRSAAPCYHLEGPYFSPGEAQGIHNPAYMRPPDWEEFSDLQDAAGGNIGIVTLAPELPGACEFIRQAKASGVLVAIGHTMATAEEIHRAVEAGADFSTHLGNGCPQWMHRHDSPLWAQLADDHLSASIICDTFHLPPELVKVISRAKGIDRCLLVSDSIFVAGLTPGRYSILGIDVELLPSGKVVKTGSWNLAGSSLCMNRAVSVFMQFAQVSPAEALQAATTNPARLLSRPGICSVIAAGEPANLMLYRIRSDSLQVEQVILNGVDVSHNY